MAAAAIQTVSFGKVPTPRQRCWSGTPEVYFSKSIDNSRLVKVEDPRHARELRQFGIALGCLFLFVMAYAFQHFKAIEYGYKIEALKSQRDSLTEMNHALGLEEATLRDPGRIDRIARSLGLQSPQAGQVVRMDVAMPESPGQVVASVMPVEVISAR
jgi:cell division protein FtsL